MNYNSRQIHINAINRSYHFTTSAAFKEASTQDLTTRWELLQGSYARFIEEHQIYVNQIPKSKLKEESDLFGQIEDIYGQTVTKLRQRIATKEAEEVVQRQEQRRNNEQNQPKPNRPGAERPRSPRMAYRQRPRTPSPDYVHEVRQDLRARLEENQQRFAQLRIDEEQLNRQLQPLAQQPSRFAQGIAMERERQKERDREIERRNRERLEQERLELERKIQEERRQRAEQERRDRERERDRRLRSVIMRPAQSEETSRFGCHLCEGPHPLNQCEDFIAMSKVDRRSTVQTLSLCQNCFRKIGQAPHQCNWRHGACIWCGHRHNSLLGCDYQL